VTFLLFGYCASAATLAARMAWKTAAKPKKQKDVVAPRWRDCSCGWRTYPTAVQNGNGPWVVQWQPAALCGSCRAPLEP
jgi:hypothetical protein